MFRIFAFFDRFFSTFWISTGFLPLLPLNSLIFIFSFNFLTVFPRFLFHSMILLLPILMADTIQLPIHSISLFLLRILFLLFDSLLLFLLLHCPHAPKLNNLLDGPIDANKHLILFIRLIVIFIGLTAAPKYIAGIPVGPQPDHTLTILRIHLYCSLGLQEGLE